MGVSYRPVAMYGKSFRTRNNLKDFITGIYPDAEVDYEIVSLDGNPDSEDVEVKCLNAYSGEDLILGYTITLGESIDPLREKWNKFFPGVEAEILHEVEIS